MILLRLYPRAWRERYEAEMLALLEEHDVTLATHLDLLRGAIDAWQDHGRSVMAPIPTIARRAAVLGVIPSAVIIATFLLGQALRSQFLVNYLGLGAFPAVVVVCLWAGLQAGKSVDNWRDRLRAGIVAGGSAGLVAGIFDWVAIASLLLAQVTFGLWVSPVPPLHASVERTLDNLLNLATLLIVVEGALAIAALGAAIGAGGAAVSAILPRRTDHPDQQPTAS
jgi:hypothetical protein